MSTRLSRQTLKLEAGGKVTVEIDKFNYIYKVGDEDLLSSVRSDLGFS